MCFAAASASNGENYMSECPCMLPLSTISGCRFGSDNAVDRFRIQQARYAVRIILSHLCLCDASVTTRVSTLSVVD